MAHAPRFLKLVQEAKSAVREVTVDQVKPRLEAGERFVLIDTREESEWNAGHIPGAIHLGKGVIERDIERVVPDTSTEIVLYCGGGYRSALAARSLAQMGYANVASMDGGWRDWVQRGYPTRE